LYVRFVQLNRPVMRSGHLFGTLTHGFAVNETPTLPVTTVPFVEIQ
jgi:hypothetical protein